MRSVSLRSTTPLLFLLMAACGGDGGTGPNGPGATFFRANIDGAWSDQYGATISGALTTQPGLYILTGSNTSGANPYVVSITLYNIGGPGTYPFGVGPQIPGGTVVLAGGTAGWSTPLSGAAGTITITTLSETRITGTFEATVEATTGSATGTRTITEGTFDLAVNASGTAGPLPENAGSRLLATIAGSHWNAAAVSGNYVTPQVLVISGSNTASTVTINLVGVSGPGIYPLSVQAARTLTVTNAVNPIANMWTSSGAGGSGSVTITSFTPHRVQGEYTATLGPAPGTTTTGTLSVVNGIFDVGFVIPVTIP